MTDQEAKIVLDVMRKNADELGLGTDELTALSIAIENITMTDEIKRRIQAKLEEWRSYNTRLNYKNDFKMNYEIASVSGTIGGLKYALEELEKEKDSNTWL